jgi:hypothetical protein
MCDIAATQNCGSRNALFGSERIAEMRGQRTATGPMPVTISRLVSVTLREWELRTPPMFSTFPARDICRSAERGAAQRRESAANTGG